LNAVARRLGTPWIRINSPAGSGYSHAGFITFTYPGGLTYSPYFINFPTDTSRATRTITAVSRGSTTLQVRVPGPQGGAFYGTLIINVQTRVTGVSIAPDNTNLVIHGEQRPTQQFTPTFQPANANYGTTLTWTSSNTNVATVNSNGVVQPVAPGYTYITATTSNGIVSAPRRVNVTSLVTALTMCRPNARLTIDGDIYEQTQLSVTVTPTNATNPNVTWSSSDESVAIVDNNGNVTAVSHGVAVITATSTDGTNVTANSAITVDRLVTDIILTPVTLQILGNLHSIDRISAEVLPHDAYDHRLIWTSSNPNIVTVDNYGNVEAVSPGIAIVTATSFDGRVSTSVGVEVEQMTEGLLVRRRNLTLNIRDNNFESYLLEAAVYVPGEPNAIITWESGDESIAVVDQNGVVTAVSPGETFVTAASGTHRHRVDVTVIRLVTNIQVDRNNITLNIHGLNRESTNILATPLPGNACNVALTWRSLNPNIAVVNQNGMISAIYPGATQVVVTSNDGNAQTIINVTVRSLVTEVQIISSTPMLYVGQTHQFTANILPLNASDRTYRWESSNPNIATVSSAGVVRGVSRGNVEIRAISTCGNVVGSSNLEIRQQVTNLAVYPTSRIMETGQRFQISRIISPTNANNQTVRFRSSDPNILHVDGSGLVTAIRRGTARIYVTTNCSNITRSIDVTVIQPVVAVTMCRVSVWLFRGDALNLQATVHPSDADNQNLFWISTDSRAVNVNQNGRISTRYGGRSTVLAIAHNGVFGAVEVRTYIPVTSISSIGGTTSLAVGQSRQLTAHVMPANASDRRITWRVVSGTAVSVNPNTGMIIGRHSGAAIVRATSVCNPNIWSEVRITVVNPPPPPPRIQQEDPVQQHIQRLLGMSAVGPTLQAATAPISTFPWGVRVPMNQFSVTQYLHITRENRTPLLTNLWNRARGIGFEVNQFFYDRAIIPMIESPSVMSFEDSQDEWFMKGRYDGQMYIEFVQFMTFSWMLSSVITHTPASQPKVQVQQPIPGTVRGGQNIIVHTGNQGKHILGHNNYIEGRSVFHGTVNDAQRLINQHSGTGQMISSTKERVDFGRVIGTYVDQATGQRMETTRGIIHHSGSGSHIVPANPSFR